MKTALLCLALVACGASKQESTMKAALVTADAARSAFLTYDAQHQAAIVAAAPSKQVGADALLAWRKEQAMVTLAIDSVYRAIAVYAVLKDDPTSLQNLNSAIGLLASELAAAGVKP